MGMNELLITELVMENIFKGLQPPEVAALLSALVFRAKSKEDESLSELQKDWTPNLKEVSLTSMCRI